MLCQSNVFTFLGYGITVLFYLLKLKGNLKNNYFLFGNLLLLIGYICIFYYHKYYLGKKTHTHAVCEVSEDKKEEELLAENEKIKRKRVANVKVFGVVLVIMFYVLSFVLPISGKASFYDVLPIIGYVALAIHLVKPEAMNVKIYDLALVMYLVLSLSSHPNLDLTSAVQALGRVVLLYTNIAGFLA